MPDNDVSINDRQHTGQWSHKLQWSWISYRKWKDTWFGRNFFPLMEQYLLRLAIDSLSKHLNFECTDECQSINHWLVSAQRSLSSRVQHSIFRGHYNLARSSFMIFRVHCCDFFVDDLRSYIRIQVYRSYLNILNVNVPLIKAFCNLFLYFGNIYRLEWYNA